MALFAVLALSCAYYNTLYNAKKRYKEVNEQPRGREGELTRQQRGAYDYVIEKCQTMIGTWPNSRHVDDAMLLIANCLFQQERYGECVAEVDSLLIKWPKTNLKPDARFLKGKALARWGEHVEAVQVLEAYLEKYPKHKSRAEALYYLATNSITLGREDAAVGYMNELEKHYKDSDITFEAQIEVADILAGKKHYEQALGVYEALNEDRLPRAFRFGVWLGLAESYVQTGQYEKALDMVTQIEGLTLSAEQEPEALLVKARAYTGLDSSQATIDTYRDVCTRFSRGVFAAEARFRLGEIYEAADSLQKAKSNYDQVGRAYARSEFAIEAVRRSGSIAKLMRLEQMEGTDSPEALALRDFSLAELQLTQFHDSKKALATYEKLIVQYPESEFAPKAAYAAGYIYGILMGDSVRAREKYDLLQTRYPSTQQAQFAYLFVPGMEGNAWDELAAAPAAAVADSVPAPADTISLAAPAPADTLVRPAPARVDTAVAPPPPPPDTLSVPAPGDSARARKGAR